MSRATASYAENSIGTNDDEEWTADWNRYQSRSSDRSHRPYALTLKKYIALMPKAQRWGILKLWDSLKEKIVVMLFSLRYMGPRQRHHSGSSECLNHYGGTTSNVFWSDNVMMAVGRYPSTLAIGDSWFYFLCYLVTSKISLWTSLRCAAWVASLLGFVYVEFISTHRYISSDGVFGYRWKRMLLS